jgi:hypothetical protein
VLEKKALIVAIMVLSINLWIYEKLRMLIIGHEKPTNILKKILPHNYKLFYIISKRNQMNQDKRKKQNPPTKGRDGDPLLFSEHLGLLLPHPMF